MDKFEKLSKITSEHITSLSKLPFIDKLISNLSDSSRFETGIFGGAIRDWYLNKLPKDIDIVTYCSQEDFDSLVKELPIGSVTKTNLGGLKIELSGEKIDLWRMQDSWVFNNLDLEVSWENLVSSVLFNTDAIIITLSGAIYEAGFWNAIETQTIDLYNVKSPWPELFIFNRALRFLNKYKFEASDKLSDFLKEFLINHKIEIKNQYGIKQWLDPCKSIDFAIEKITWQSSNEYLIQREERKAEATSNIGFDKLFNDL